MFRFLRQRLAAAAGPRVPRRPWLLLALLVGLVASGSAHAQEQLLPVGGPLNVVLMDSISFDSANVDAYYFATQGIEAAFREAKLDHDLRFHRFGERIPRQEPRIIIHIYQFSPSTVRLMAILDAPEGRVNLGYFKEDQGFGFSPQGDSGQSSERVKTMQLATAKMWAKLRDYMPPPARE